MRTAVSLVLAATLAAALLRGQQESELERLLAMSPSAGVEAMLMAHVREARVLARWRPLLNHPDVPVREAVARIFGVSGARYMATDLLLALAREQNRSVIAELVQAVAIVASGDDVRHVTAHLDRIDEDRARAVLDGLTAARPGVMTQLLTSADPLRARSAWVDVVYERLATIPSVDLAALEIALGTSGRAPVLEGLLLGARHAGRRLPISAVVAASRHPDVDRLAIATYLAATYRTTDRVRAEAALQTLESTPVSEEASPDQRWANELLRRWLGHGPPASLEAVIPELTVRVAGDGLQVPVLTVLTRGEQAALERRFGKALFADRSSPTPPTTAATLSEIPAAILTDVLRVTNCRPARNDERFATVRYRPDRRPQQVVLPPDGWSPGCDRAARALAPLAYGVPPRDELERISLLVLLDEPFVACVAARQRAGPLPEVVGRPDIREPRKVYDERPVYPMAAQASRISGVVRVEARIEPTGCVAEARVVQSAHPFLDEAAIRAVARWRYTPTLLEGTPVAVVMNVTVSFSLK